MLSDQRDLDVEPRSTSRRTVDLDRSTQRLDAILEPDQTRACARIGSSRTVVENRETKSLLLGVQINLHMRGVGVPRGVRERLRDHVVGSYLDLVGEPVLGAYVELHRDRRPKGQCLECRRESALRQDRWMDAARHLAEFLDHARQSISETTNLRPYVL